MAQPAIANGCTSCAAAGASTHMRGSGSPGNCATVTALGFQPVRKDRALTIVGRVSVIGAMYNSDCAVGSLSSVV